MKSLEMRREEVLLSERVPILFGAVALFLGLSIYAGEKIIRANPHLIPVKTQIRSFINRGEFHPVPDPDIGFLGPPNLRTRVSTGDFESLQESDAHGFPNRMPWPETADIVVLGDSLLGGVGVGIDGHFSTLIGKALPIKGIMNLGIRGAAPNRQLRAFRKFGASFRPGLVVSCIYLAADLDGQLQFDSWLREGVKADYNQYRLDFSDRQHPKSFWTRVQRRSYLAGKLTELALRWWGIPDRISFSSGPDVLLDIDSLRLRSIGIDRQDPRMLSMIKSLKDMRVLSQSGGANFLVVLIPSKEEIYGAPFVPEVMKPAQTLEQRLKEEGFSVLSTYGAVRERAKHRSAFFPHDIHLNAFGNQIVSDSLVNWLKQTRSLSAEKSAVKTGKSRIGAYAGSS
jgi:hypothetical protein